VTYTFAWTVQGESLTFSASGSGTPLSPSSSQFTFTPPAVGSYLVSVSAVGSDGSSGAATLLTQAKNIAPTVVISGAPPDSVPEGTEVTLAAQATDPGGANDTLKYAWSVTGPDGFSQTGNSTTITFVPNEVGTYVASVTVTDAASDFTIATKHVVVTHVPP